MAIILDTDVIVQGERAKHSKLEVVWFPVRTDQFEGVGGYFFLGGGGGGGGGWQEVRWRNYGHGVERARRPHSAARGTLM